MKKLSYMEWTPSISVGIERIDAQHRSLFDTTNRLIDIFESGSDYLLPVFNELFEYISFHFWEEHMLMIKIHYPYFDSHEQAHMIFTEKLREFVKRNDQENNRDLEFDMIAFLKDWIVNHIKGMDMQYADYIRRLDLPEHGLILTT